MNRGARALGYPAIFPSGDKVLSGSPNPEAVDQTLSFLKEQHANRWEAFERIGDTIDKAYEDGMKRYVKSSLGKFYQ